MIYYFPESSNVHSIEYYPSNIHNGNLEIVYKTDIQTVYTYLKVPEDIFKEIIAAKSVGAAVDKLIKKASPAFICVKSIKSNLNYSQLADEFIRTMEWKTDTPDYYKSIVYGNVRGFAIFIQSRVEKGKK